MQELVISTFVQDAVGRVASYVFSKREDRASTGHNIERLEIAHTELELALERTRKLPITDVSLLRRRKILKHAFEECSVVVQRCKLQAQEDEKIERGQTVMHSSLPKKIAHATQSSIAYLVAKKKDSMYCSDVRRFEWLADCAGKFVRDVESGCSLRHYTFCNPLLRQLLKGKTLRYKKVHGSRLRDIYLWPVCLEGRGVEAKISCKYEDYQMPEKNFHLRLMLRLSESIDIVGIAIKCLQYLASQFKLVVETATREVTLLHDVHDISHSYAPPPDGIQELYAQLTQVCQPDPTCCKSDGLEKCSENIVFSELTNKFPEQVIFISIQCSLHTSIDEVGRHNLVDWSPSLLLKAGFGPHAVPDYPTQSYEITFADRPDRRDGNVEEEIDMVKSKTIDCFIRQPELANYMTFWQYVHGFAFFKLLTPTATRLVRVHELKDRSKTKRVAKRRRQEV